MTGTESQITCFLIDDDTDDQEIFCTAIAHVDNSIRCVCASNCMEAIEMINADESFLPHCIFIDMNMPMLNGTECLKAIKKIARVEHIPVFMYSTFAAPEAISETRQLGAIDFIVKPTTISSLTETLKHIFLNQN